MALDRTQLPDAVGFRAKAARLAKELGAPRVPVAVLLALPHTGQSSTLMAELTGLSQSYCYVQIKKVRERLTDDQGQFYCQWLLDGLAGEVAFVCDCLVLMGKARRFKGSDGEHLYVATGIKRQLIDPREPATVLTEGEKFSARRDGSIVPYRPKEKHGDKEI